MSPRLDAHAHFFYPGYVGRMPESCRRQVPDEITVYQAYAQQHDISQVLAVGYEGDAWAAGNNAYLATLAAQHKWVRPVAFVAEPAKLTVEQLQSWQSQRFVGISLYLFDERATAALSSVAHEVWAWLAENRWLLSINSTGANWASWHAVLKAHPSLRLLIAHLGLPPAMATAPTLDEARTTLAPVLTLAEYPETVVKFSGFYALATPGHAYPHAPSWPYAEVITHAYGTSRIVWASDFSPALEFVSFPQTIDVLHAMPWLTESDLATIFHDNLARLLAAIDERNGVS